MMSSSFGQSIERKIIANYYDKLNAINVVYDNK